MDTRDVTVRQCDTCRYSLNFGSTAEAERFMSSSHWIATLQGYRCPVCVEYLAKAAKAGQSAYVRPHVGLIRRAL